MSDVGSGNYILLYSGPTAATFLPSQRSGSGSCLSVCSYGTVNILRNVGHIHSFIVYFSQNTFWSLLLLGLAYFMCVSST